MIVLYSNIETVWFLVNFFNRLRPFLYITTDILTIEISSIKSEFKTSPRNNTQHPNRLFSEHQKRRKKSTNLLTLTPHPVAQKRKIHISQITQPTDPHLHPINPLKHSKPSSFHVTPHSSRSHLKKRNPVYINHPHGGDIIATGNDDFPATHARSREIKKCTKRGPLARIYSGCQTRVIRGRMPGS